MKMAHLLLLLFLLIEMLMRTIRFFLILVLKSIHLADAILQKNANCKTNFTEEEELNSADRVYLQQKRMVDNFIHCLGLYGMCTFFSISIESHNITTTLFVYRIKME